LERRKRAEPSAQLLLLRGIERAIAIDPIAQRAALRLRQRDDRLAQRAPFVRTELAEVAAQRRAVLAVGLPLPDAIAPRFDPRRHSGRRPAPVLARIGRRRRAVLGRSRRAEREQRDRERAAAEAAHPLPSPSSAIIAASIARFAIPSRSSTVSRSIATARSSGDAASSGSDRVAAK